MKAFTLSPSIEAQPDLANLIRSAEPVLEDVLGPSAGLVSAEWDVDRDKHGRRLIHLTLSDWTGTASSLFVEDELRQRRHLWDRLHHLWGDVLQDRSRKQLERLRQLVPSGDEG